MNESPTDKLIRELREENAKLLEMIKKGNYQITDAPSETSEEGKLKQLETAWKFYCKNVLLNCYNYTVPSINCCAVELS